MPFLGGSGSQIGVLIDLSSLEAQESSGAVRTFYQQSGAPNTLTLLRQ